MKNLIKIILILTFSIFLFTSCEKENDIVQAEKEYVINNNSEQLNKANIIHLNEKLVLTNSNLNINLVSESTSPIVNGIGLSASYILKRGNKLYVTYHVRGNEYGGSVVIYDVTINENPIILSQIDFNKIDINACDVNVGNNSLYLAGSSKNKGAVLIKINLSNGLFASEPQIVKYGNAASANGIIQADKWLYLSMGNTNGGLYCIRESNLNVFEPGDLYNGSKFSTANGRLAGDNHLSLEVNPITNNAYLHVYVVDRNDPFEEHVWPLGSISTQNVEDNFTNFGKHTIFIEEGSDICYVSMGEYGMKAINISNGEIVYESPLNMIIDGNTNAVSCDNDYIYMANGEQGLYIAERPISGNIVNIVGIWDNNINQGSVNMVYSDGDYIYVAKGKDGLKILKNMN